MKVNVDKFFDSQKPTITVFGKEYQVDDDYKKVIGMNKYGETVDKSAEDGGLRALIEYALVDGKAAADEILSHNFSFAFYQKLNAAVQSAMSGKPIEEIEENIRKAETSGRFQGGQKKRV